MIRVAIVGCGAIAERSHLPAYLKLTDRAQIVAFVDPDETRARHLQSIAGGGQIYRDISELPAPSEIDLVDVCVPHLYHLPIGAALLSAGYPLWLEKPMAMTTADCDTLLDAARKGGARLGVALHTRFEDRWIAARNFVLSGKAGRPLYAIGAFNSNMASFHRVGGAVTPWRASPEGGGGALLDLGIYLADLLVWIFGDPVLVQAMRVPHSPSDPPAGRRGSEMTGLVNVQLQNGVVGSFVATWDYPDAKLPPVAQPTFGYKFVCEGGVLFAPDSVQGAPLVFYPAGRQSPLFVDPPQVPGEIPSVVAAVEARAEFPVTGQEGRRSVALIEAALESIYSCSGVRPH